VTTHVYDPKSITLSICGALISGGFSEDSIVKVTQGAKRFEKMVGALGDVCRVKQHDRTAMVTISLMQSANANDVLSAILSRDENSPNGAGVGAFVLKDLQGTTLITAAHAWIDGYPESEFGKKVNGRSWEITLADCEILVGGNVAAL